MQKRRFISLFLCFALLIGFSCPVLAEEAGETETTGPEMTTVDPETQIDFLSTNASVAFGCQTLNAQVPMRSDEILDTATAGLLYEVNSGTLMYGENVDQTVYPGSFVKLMTALLAIEREEITQQITVSQETLNRVPENSSIQGFLAGEVLTLEQLLYSMVVQSANDAAAIIAEYIAGSQESFVEAMNEKAAEIGCTGTHFTNVHGIHDDQQYTTPRDLAKIMEYGLQYDLFQELLAVSQYTIAATNLSEERQLNSTNLMLSENGEYYDGRVTGGKVSTNQEGRRSLIVTAEDNGLRYIGIVADTLPEYSQDGYSIQCYQDFVEMKNLLDLGCDHYQVKQVLYDGQIISRYTVTNGKNSVAVGPATSVMSVLPENVSINNLSLRFQRTDGVLNAPVEKGQTVDILQVWYGSVCIAQSELAAMNSSEVMTVMLEDPGSDQGLNNSDGLVKVLAVLGVILVVIVGFVAVLYIIRIIRRVISQKRRRRRRTNRRRNR